MCLHLSNQLRVDNEVGVDVDEVGGVGDGVGVAVWVKELYYLLKGFSDVGGHTQCHNWLLRTGHHYTQLIMVDREAYKMKMLQ